MMPRVIYIQSTRACFGLCVQYAQRSCMNTCMLAHAQRRFLVFANKTMLAVVGACGHMSAYGLLGGCAHALLSMWVDTYFFSAICNERWALISFGDICGSACHCICSYTLIIPPPHTLLYYPRTKLPCSTGWQSLRVRKIRTIRKSAVRWRGRRARGYRKSICVRIYYTFLISKCRRG